MRRPLLDLPCAVKDRIIKNRIAAQKSFLKRKSRTRTGPGDKAAASPSSSQPDARGATEERTTHSSYTFNTIRSAL